MPYERRKDALREKVIAAGPDAVAVYAADKLSNVSDLRDLYAKEGEEAGECFKAPLDLRLELWRRDADALAELSSPPPFAAELRRQLDALLAAREEALHNVNLGFCGGAYGRGMKTDTHQTKSEKLVQRLSGAVASIAMTVSLLAGLGSAASWP